MTGAPDRIRAVTLIKEAVDAGARTGSACREIGISLRTFQRWTQTGEVKADGRPDADRPPPNTKLTHHERQAVLDTLNSPAYYSLPPSQVVPALADEGRVAGGNALSIGRGEISQQTAC
jgi:putative transposase